MSLMKWQGTFEVGIEEFDDHHKRLVGLINKIYDDFTSGASFEVLGTVLDELIAYASYHFAAEEYWMNEHNYPLVSRHLNEHNGFSSKLVEFQKDFMSGKENLSLDVLTFLMSWLSDHIIESDAHYGNFAKR